MTDNKIVFSNPISSSYCPLSCKNSPCLVDIEQDISKKNVQKNKKISDSSTKTQSKFLPPQRNKATHNF